MQLRKCCNHPYLFDGAEPGPPYTTEKHLVDNAGKMVLLDQLLERLKAQGSRVLLFSQMSRMIDILEDYCQWKGFQYCRLDGNTPHADRTDGIEEFNREGSEKFIYLLTTRAGGLGINLATADIVIMYDNDWNPQVDLQAEDRAHRIGQKKQVVVFRFITENAVEEKVIDRATQKLRLDTLVIQQGRQVPAKGAAKDDLVSMIQYGAASIFQSVDSTISTDGLDAILKRSEIKTTELETKYKDMGLEDIQKFSVEEKGESSYQWEGEDFRDKRASRGGMNWIGPSKRDRKLNFEAESASHQMLMKARRERAPKVKSGTSHEFQFYPARVIELQEKQKYALWQSLSYRPAPEDAPPGFLPDSDTWLASEQLKIDHATPLSQDELNEKDNLLSGGFENWSRRDFNAFVKANERYGRNAMDSVANEVEGKTPDEVIEYSKVFWQRFTEIPDHDKMIKLIEKGEEKLQKTCETQDLLTSKVMRYRLPLQQITVTYGQNRGKTYNEEEDRFLIVCMQKFGFGSDELYERIRTELKKSPLFRFDWFIKSRTPLVLV